MNSTAAIKAFCGERGGLVCTSSNAARGFRVGVCAGGEDFVSARSASGPQYGFAMGIPLDEMVVWDPYQINGGVSAGALQAAR